MGNGEGEAAWRYVEMTRSRAEQMSGWRYEPPYEIYDGSDSSQSMAELLSGAYFAAVDEAGELVGFVCFGTTAQVPAGHETGAYARTDVLDIGLGLRPDLCGRGRGIELLRGAMRLGRERFDARAFRLTVATFNRRAIVVYERMGFHAGLRFDSGLGKEAREFMVMTRDGGPAATPRRCCLA